MPMYECVDTYMNKYVKQHTHEKYHTYPKYKHSQWNTPVNILTYHMQKIGSFVTGPNYAKCTTYNFVFCMVVPCMYCIYC